MPNERIAAINCQDYINGPFWDGFSDNEKKDVLSELAEPEH